MPTQLNLVKGISKGNMLDIATNRGEGAFALDHQGGLLFLNKEAERLIGWQLDDFSGQNFFHTANFKMDAIASIGASKCAALNSVGCSHLQKGASITSKNGSVLAIVYISLPVFDEGKMFGKVYVFKENNTAADQQGHFSELVDSCASAILKIDLAGKVAYANDYARKRFGDGIDLVIPTLVRAAIRDNPDTLANHDSVVNRCKDVRGQIVSMAWSFNALHEGNGKVIGAVCIGTDISEFESKPMELVPDKVLAQKVFTRMSDGVVTIDQKGVVEYLNPIAEQLTGWSKEESRGLLFNDVFHYVDEKTRVPKVEALMRNVHDEQFVDSVSAGALLRRDGWEFNIEVSSTIIRDVIGMVLGSVIIFRDVSEMHGTNRWMNYESSHDALTGLMNRSEFESNVTHALTNARSDGRQHALCYIDIDRFKNFNSQQGQEAGDEILKQVSSLLHGKVRDSDIIARIGDDEFGVLLKNCSLENARETTQEFCSCISKNNFIWQGVSFELSVSVGLVPITSESGGIADVMRIADSACYVAKDKGRGRVHTYKDQTLSTQQHHGELQWVQRIRQALENDQFRLYCQSIVPLTDQNKKPVHHEILLRMIDENGDIIRPGAFLSSAERFNLMPSIDRWVVKSALSMLNNRVGRKQSLGIFSINISAQSLDDENFLGFVIDQLDQTKFPASNICFEITESTAISNLMSATRFMSIMRGMGCRFALDDFGRGFSSYAYLKNLPVDYLKIDGSFIRDIAHDPVDFAMVESINQIGHIMGVETIAEFVESEEALEKLIHLGVDHVQGYQLGKPRPMWHSFQTIPALQHA